VSGVPCAHCGNQMHAACTTRVRGRSLCNVCRNSEGKAEASDELVHPPPSLRRGAPALAKSAAVVIKTEPIAVDDEPLAVVRKKQRRVPADDVSDDGGRGGDNNNNNNNNNDDDVNLSARVDDDDDDDGDDGDDDDKGDRRARNGTADGDESRATVPSDFDDEPVRTRQAADSEYDDSNSDRSSNSSVSNSNGSSSSSSGGIVGRARPPLRQAGASNANVVAARRGRVARSAKLSIAQVPRGLPMRLATAVLLDIGELVVGPRASLFVSQDAAMIARGIARFPVNFKFKRTFKIDQTTFTVMCEILDDEMRGPIFRVSGNDIQIERESITDAVAALAELFGSPTPKPITFFGFGTSSVTEAYEKLIASMRGKLPVAQAPAQAPSSKATKRVAAAAAASATAAKRRRAKTDDDDDDDDDADDGGGDDDDDEDDSGALSDALPPPAQIKRAKPPTARNNNKLVQSLLLPTGAPPPPPVAPVPTAASQAAFDAARHLRASPPLVDEATLFPNNSALAYPLAAITGKSSDIVVRWINALKEQDIETVGDVRSLTAATFERMSAAPWCTMLLHSALTRVRAQK